MRLGNERARAGRATRLLVLAAAVAGCNPTLTVQSPAPPGRTARLDHVDGFWGLKRYRLELSRGVAIAMTCEHDGPCEHMRVVSDDPAIAEVRAAALGVLQASLAGEQTAAALVIVGKAAGHTHVHVTAGGRTREIDVTIVAAPAPATPLTAAR